jgi:signal transduction histidine kinase
MILAVALFFELLTPPLFPAGNAADCGIVFRLRVQPRYTSEDRRDHFELILPTDLTGKTEVRDPFLDKPISLGNLDVPFVMELRRRFRAAIRTFLKLTISRIEHDALSVSSAYEILDASLDSGWFHASLMQAYGLVAWAAIHHEKPQEFFQSAVHGFRNARTSIVGFIELAGEFIGDQKAFISTLERLLDTLTIKNDHDLITGVSGSAQSADRDILVKHPTVTIGTIESDGQIRLKEFPEKRDVTGEMTEPVWEGLALALEELVWNAMKYSDGTTVGIYADRSQPRYVVVNEGPGIPDTLDPFSSGVRGDYADIPGTGYGLSSVVSVLDSIGWEVILESRREPTRFVVRKKGE